MSWTGSLAAQMREIELRKVRTPALQRSGLFSISMACMQATGGYPPEILNEKGEFSISGMQMQVDENGEGTGMFRTKRLAGTSKPRGNWPENWVDSVHEFNGHGVDASPEERIGEKLLMSGLNSLYVQCGVESAYDDVSGAALDPALVRAAVTSGWVSLRAWVRTSEHLARNRRRPAGKLSGQSGSTLARTTWTLRRLDADWWGRNSGLDLTMLYLHVHIHWRHCVSL